MRDAAGIAKNIASGLLLIAIGSFFASSGRHLDVSSVENMGQVISPWSCRGS